MEIQVRRERRQIRCPEGDRVTHLLLSWQEEGEGLALCGIHCDDPRLRDLDNWECRWSCWEQIASEG
jgi:hypothetical protein